MRAEVPQKFKIDCTEAGKAPLKVVVKEPDGEKEPIKLLFGQIKHIIIFTLS